VLKTIEDEATGEWSNATRIRGLLGAFLFGEDAIDKKVKVLSGGEKSRLALAKLLLKPINLLILDEPTNHLDITSKEVLKQALVQYDGTLIVVSHDRDFLQGLTNKTYEFSHGKVKEHLGDINEFLENHKVETFRQFEAAKNETKKTPVTENTSSNKEKYEQKKQQEKELKRLKNTITKCEREIAQLETAIAVLEQKMLQPDFYTDAANSQRITSEHAGLKKKIDEFMTEWQIASDGLEKVAKGL
jgi:ATP-binding cassette subfamily F protein 3